MNARSPCHDSQPDVLLLCEHLPSSALDPATVRATQMLKDLSRFCRVHLACFADPAALRFEAGRVRALCYENCIVAHSPARRRLAAWRALAGGRSAALGCAGDPTLSAWIARLRRRHPLRAAIACSPAMASYLLDLDGVLRIVDAAGAPAPRSRRDARLQAAHAARVAQCCEHVLQTGAVPHGVDCDDYSPFVLRRNPYPSGTVPLLLARPDDAASDACARFIDDVFAPLHAMDPRLRLFALSAPARAGWTREPGVTLADPGADVRPFLTHAAAVLVPAPSADLLPAMAMQKPVLASAAALAGTRFAEDGEVLSGATPAQLRTELRAALDPATAHALGRAARARVLRDYSWQIQLARLIQDAAHAG